MISGILNVINVVRPHILGDGNVFSRHQQVKRMSDGSHVIYGILNVVNVVRHYLVMERLKNVRMLILSSICHRTAASNNTSNQ